MFLNQEVQVGLGDSTVFLNLTARAAAKIMCEPYLLVDLRNNQNTCFVGSALTPEEDRVLSAALSFLQFHQPAIHVLIAFLAADRWVNTVKRAKKLEHFLSSDHVNGV